MLCSTSIRTIFLIGRLLSAKIFNKSTVITSNFNNYTTTATTRKDLNGKDLYAPKYGNSHYDPQHYHTNFFHTPQCMPNLKEEENEYYDEQHKNTDKEKTREAKMGKNIIEHHMQHQNHQHILPKSGKIKSNGSSKP